MADARAYLDWNASAPLLPAAREATVAALDNSTNPSSVHAGARAARALIENARREVAALVGAKAENVVFTSGATEAASTLLNPRWTRSREPFSFGHLYVCAADHPCTLRGGAFDTSAVTSLAVDRSGLLDLEVLRKALAAHDRTQGDALVAVHAANNETGVVQPWPEIGTIVREAGAVLVLDAVQAAGRVSLAQVLEHADAIILSSHKLGGPKGAGAFLVRDGSAMPRPMVTGGGQERGLRSGTENVPCIAGFGAAARQTPARLARAGEVQALRDRFEAALLQRVPDAVIHGRAAPRLGNTCFFTLPGVRAETAQMMFDLCGVALSAGSACSSGKVGRSHVLEAMGVPSGQSALRVSIGPETGEAELAGFVDALEKVVQRRHGSHASAQAA